MVLTLKKKYDLSFMVVSFVISFVGIYVAVGMLEQLRLSLIEDRNVHGAEVKVSRRKKHLLYLVLCAFGFGGIALWGMHYVSLYSLHLVDDQGHRYQHRSNIGVQIVTFFMIVIIEIIAFTSASYDGMFSKTKLAIINEFIADSKSLSMKEIQNITLKKLWIILGTTQLSRIVVSGIFSGCGVLLTIYLGLYGMAFDGNIQFDIGWIAFAVIICLSCSIVTYWIFFRLLSIFPDQEWLRTSIAFVGSISCSLSNYLAIFSAEFRTTEPGEQDLFHQRVTGMSQNSWERFTSFYFTFVATNILLWIVAMYTLITARHMIHRQSHWFQQAENIVYKVAEENSLPLPLARQRMYQQKYMNSDDDSNANNHQNHHRHSHMHGRFDHSSSVTLKRLVEQYVNRRCGNEFTNNARSSAPLRNNNNANSDSIHSKNNNSANSKTDFPYPTFSYDHAQQENMSFSEYLCHLVYLLFCCRWNQFVVAVGWEFCPELFENATTVSRQSRDTITTGNSKNNNSTFSSHQQHHFKQTPISLDEESTLDSTKPHPKPQYKHQPEPYVDLEEQQIYTREEIVGNKTCEQSHNKLHDNDSWKSESELLYSDGINENYRSGHNSDSNSDSSSDSNKDSLFDKDTNLEEEDKMMDAPLKIESYLPSNNSSSNSKNNSQRQSQGNNSSSNNIMFAAVRVAPIET